MHQTRYERTQYSPGTPWGRHEQSPNEPGFNQYEPRRGNPYGSEESSFGGQGVQRHAQQGQYQYPGQQPHGQQPWQGQHQGYPEQQPGQYAQPTQYASRPASTYSAQREQYPNEPGYAVQPGYSGQQGYGGGQQTFGYGAGQGYGGPQGFGYSGGTGYGGQQGYGYTGQQGYPEGPQRQYYGSEGPQQGQPGEGSYTTHQRSSGQYRPDERDQNRPHEQGGGRNPNARFGKAPKNYRRSDDRVREDVCETIMRDPDIDASDVDVQIKNSTCVLEGTVPNRWMKRHIEDLAEQCMGIEDVENRVRVKRDDETTSESGRSSSDEERDTVGSRSSSGSKRELAVGTAGRS